MWRTERYVASSCTLLPRFAFVCNCTHLFTYSSQSNSWVHWFVGNVRSMAIRAPFCDTPQTRLTYSFGRGVFRLSPTFPPRTDFLRTISNFRNLCKRVYCQQVILTQNTYYPLPPLALFWWVLIALTTLLNFNASKQGRMELLSLMFCFPLVYALPILHFCIF